MDAGAGDRREQMPPARWIAVRSLTRMPTGRGFVAVKHRGGVRTAIQPIASAACRAATALASSISVTQPRSATIACRVHGFADTVFRLSNSGVTARNVELRTGRGARDPADAAVARSARRVGAGANDWQRFAQTRGTRPGTEEWSPSRRRHALQRHESLAQNQTKEPNAPWDSHQLYLPRRPRCSQCASPPSTSARTPST